MIIWRNWTSPETVQSAKFDFHFINVVGRAGLRFSQKLHNGTRQNNVEQMAHVGGGKETRGRATCHVPLNGQAGPMDYLRKPGKEETCVISGRQRDLS